MLRIVLLACALAGCARFTDERPIRADLAADLAPVSDASTSPSGD
jgi:hypothetical protein